MSRTKDAGAVGGRAAVPGSLRSGIPLRPGSPTVPFAGPQQGSFAGGSFVVDSGGHILAFDRAMERLTGWSTFEVVGRHKDLGFYDKPDETGVRRYRARPLFEGSLPRAERTLSTRLTMNARDGSQFEVEALVTPLGQDRRRYAVEIKRVLARIAGPVIAPPGDGVDAVTRLPDATKFHERLREAFARARLSGQPLAVLIVDIDGYSLLEGKVGQATGSDVLRRAGGILRAMVRQDDMVARLEKDHFGIILEGAGRGDARLVGGRIRQTVERFSFARGDGDELRVTVSIGAACFPADGETAAELFRRAQEALREAKRLGRNRVWCYVRRPRVPLATPVYFDGPAAQVLGMSRDLSNSGLFVETKDLLPVGLRLGLSFHLPGEAEPVRCVGRVARTAPDDPTGRPGGLGIEFERYAGDGRRRIEAFIHRSLS
ncbi:MAG: diguanylate cyclase [Acidobacteria bacterium]|nr:MAG: diguanylate cyclase [Acidobacteriota bacterium]